jgi:hypothetical protein
MINAAYFGIQYTGSANVWMEPCGNLSSQLMAKIFETATEAQAFLDTRRLRRGFRQSLAVAPIAVETIRELAATARDYSTLPPLPARDDRQEWADRADALESLLPLTVH